MKRTSHLLATALAGMLALPAIAQQQDGAGQQQGGTGQQQGGAAQQGGEPVGVEEQTVAEFVNADGQQIGSANLVDVPAGGLLVNVQVEGLPTERWLAFHFHENGECNPEDGFESAGGHYGPEGNDHGYYVESGPHAGDMPNQYVGADGIMRSWVHNHRVSLDGEEPSVRGRALVIHAGQDDYESQPSGDAGDRLACAVIE